MISHNFTFLRKQEPQLERLGGLAERYFRDDPSTAIVKLRQYAELLSKIIAARNSLYLADQETFEEMLRRLSLERILPREIADFFHSIRKSGNAAVHQLSGNHSEALLALKYAWRLGIWFHQTYANEPNFKAGAFVPPPEPLDATQSLKEEIAALNEKLKAAADRAELAKQQAAELALANATAEERLAKEAEDRIALEQLLDEAAAGEAANKKALADLQAASLAAAPAIIAQFIPAGEAAAAQIDLDEFETRALIDMQLRGRGWEADTKLLRYSAGIRPSKGRNIAIAEWPTSKGPADYALFVGLKLIGFVEAKRRRKNVSAAIDQAQRYAEGANASADFEFAGGPWDAFKVPFVFSTNGRAYLKQIETESGIWFRDTRRTGNHRRALADWPTPEGLVGSLDVDLDDASTKLKAMPFDFGFELRPYQRAAIEAVETALDAGRREMLVAMATGTGKTKLAIAMLYRLLSAKRFRSICFVVDRSALGNQTEGEFSTTKVVSGKTFADIFGLKGLSDIAPEMETKVHICTIQGLVKRILFATDNSETPAIDQYDLMVIDECHRGYLLDREMSDAELSFRGQDDYISKYRRILDYFDAVKIGLTATPALHTAQIFGDPIYRYSYREAVIDGYLIDHEPPIRIETALTRSGIGFSQGEQVEYIAPSTGAVQSITLPDVLHFDVEQFNRQVITEPFNQAVAGELAKHIDPALPGKTLIFAATDAHADIVVKAIKEAFKDAYGEIEDSSVRKITGSVDKVQALIKSFRNDADPKIAVTVDLLTTGIDVPSITNLVFLRRVNSRILYEQMIGRATRRCPEIDKTIFRIFDAVDIYTHLQDLTDMKPVVVNPSITFQQMVEELLKAENDVQRETIREQLIVKLRRRLTKMPDEVRQRFEAAAGETANDALARMMRDDAAALAHWFSTKGNLGSILDWSSNGNGPNYLPISQHPDHVVDVSRGYGSVQRPEDFLDSFAAFVRDNINKIAALKLVVQRPRDLTRADLKSLRMELDRSGFSEANLRRAWADAKNEDIAASVIGFVRQAAIGDALVPFEDRVKAAMRRILASRAWTDPQKRWLARIAEQIEKEFVVDREAIDQQPFVADGGFNRLNKVFGGELELVLGNINDEMWKVA